MFKGGAFRVAIGIARGDIKVIQHTRLINQLFCYTDTLRQFPHELRNNVTPCFLSQVEMESFDSLLGGLLGGKTGPLMPSRLSAILRLFQVFRGLLNQSRARLATISSPLQNFKLSQMTDQK